MFLTFLNDECELNFELEDYESTHLLDLIIQKYVFGCPKVSIITRILNIIFKYLTIFFI